VFYQSLFNLNVRQDSITF